MVSLQKVVDESPTDLGDLVAQCTLSADRSGSAARQWPDVYQEAAERMLGLVMTGLDDDRKVPFFVFDDQLVHEAVLGEDNYAGYVEHMHRRAGTMGGTAYSPVISKLLSLGDPATEKDEAPFFHLFCTDGEPRRGDRSTIETLLIKARTRPHFFQFVLIGGDSDGEAYLQHLNKDLAGPGVDNVGLTIYSGFPPGDDTAFYNDVISEFFPIWLPEARKQGITSR